MRFRTLPLMVATALCATTIPAFAQAPNPGQLLQGLLSGNQGQDQAVRDAYERGYNRGRQDQQRSERDRGPPPRDDRGGYYPPPPPQPYGR